MERERMADYRRYGWKIGVVLICVAPNSLWADMWQHSTASLPGGPRYAMSGVGVGGVALFAGGWPRVDTVDIYNPSAAPGSGWSAASLSVARYDMGAVAVGDKALFAGGAGPTADSSRVDIYDSTSGSWTTSELSRAVYAPTAAACGSLAFFAGGANLEPGDYTLSDVVDIWNSTTGMWSTQRLSVPRFGMGAASVGTKVLFAGGQNSISLDPGQVPTVTDVVDIFDTSTNTWSTHTLSTPRGFLGAATVGTKVLFAGGWLGDIHGQTTGRVDIYDSETDTWTTAELSVARHRIAAAVLGDLVLFAGGTSGSQPEGTFTEYSTVDVYDARSGTWSVGPSLAEARHDPEVAVVGNQALFAGGYDWGASSTVDIYTVPVPAAALLGVLGLGSAGWWLRRDWGTRGQVLH